MEHGYLLGLSLIQSNISTDVLIASKSKRIHCFDPLGLEFVWDCFLKDKWF